MLIILSCIAENPRHSNSCRVIVLMDPPYTPYMSDAFLSELVLQN